MEPLAVRKKKFFDTLEAEGIKKDIIEAFKAVDPIRFFDKMFQDKFYTNDFIPVGYGEKSDSIRGQNDQRSFSCGEYENS